MMITWNVSDACSACVSDSCFCSAATLSLMAASLALFSATTALLASRAAWHLEWLVGQLVSVVLCVRTQC